MTTGRRPEVLCIYGRMPEFVRFTEIERKSLINVRNRLKEHTIMNLIACVGKSNSVKTVDRPKEVAIFINQLLKYTSSLFEQCSR